MRWKPLKIAIGWTCSILVALQLLVGMLAVAVLKFYDVTGHLRTLAGPSPWLSFGLSAGTGVFVNDRGDILTNSHVIAGCRRVTIAGDGFRGVQARLVAKLDNSFEDLAVLHVDRTPKGWLAFEKQPSLEATPEINFNVPYPISVLGFPGMMEGVTPHREPVSNMRLWRPAGDTSPKHWLLNVVATVSPGNSGSPVVDGHGHLAGLIATATFPNRITPETSLTGESGDAVYGRTIFDWLHQLGVPAVVVPSDQAITPSEIVTSAVVRVFCFGQHTAGDVGVGETRGVM